MLKGYSVQTQVLLHFPDKTIPYRLERRAGEKDSKWLVLTENGFEEEIIEDTPSIPSEPITPEPPVEPCSHEFQYIACCENGHRQKCTICNETTEMEPHDYGDGEEFCKVCGFANPDYTPEPILVADALVFNKNAYFDIPYYANNNTRVVVDGEIQYSDLSNINMMFGSRASAALEPTNTFIFVSQTSDGKMRTDYGLSGNKLLDRDYLPYDTRGIIDKNKNETFINGIEAASHNPGSPFTSPNIFRIGNFIGASFNVSYSFKGKIYSFKIYDNDNLFFDLIPIAEGQTINDQTATENGFYDKVNDTIYYSITGTAPEAEVHYEQPETKQFMLAGKSTANIDPMNIDLQHFTDTEDDEPENPIVPKQVFDIFLDTYPMEGICQYRARPYDNPDAKWEYTVWFRRGTTEPIGYTYGNYQIPEGSWGEVVTTDDMRFTYLFGVDLRASNGASFTDPQIQFYIDAAVKEMERMLNITIKKTRIKCEPEKRGLKKGEDYDEGESYYTYKRERVQRTGMINTRKRPLLEVSRLDLLSRDNQIKNLLDAVRIDKTKGRIEYLNRPIRTSDSYRGIETAIFPYGANNMERNLVYAIDYTAGFENSDEIPQDLREVIAKKAALSLLNIIGRGLMSGFSSSSLSMDGVSESFSSTQSATSAFYGADIKVYTEDIENYVAANKMKFGHVILGAL